jgi:hypothetical protein
LQPHEALIVTRVRLLETNRREDLREKFGVIEHRFGPQSMWLWMCGSMMGDWNCSGPTGWSVQSRRRRLSGPEGWFAHVEHSARPTLVFSESIDPNS